MFKRAESGEPACRIDFGRNPDRKSSRSSSMSRHDLEAAEKTSVACPEGAVPSIYVQRCGNCPPLAFKASALSGDAIPSRSRQEKRAPCLISASTAQTDQVIHADGCMCTLLVLGGSGARLHVLQSFSSGISHTRGVTPKWRCLRGRPPPGRLSCTIRQCLNLSRCEALRTSLCVCILLTCPAKERYLRCVMSPKV